MNDPAPLPRYRFGPLERRGLVAGWRGGQIAVVALAGVLVVAILRRSPSMIGLLLALCTMACAVGVATWPFGGLTVEEWAPDAVRHARRVVDRRATSFRSPLATLEVLTVESGEDRLCAVVHDAAARTYAVVMPVRGDSFVLLGTAHQVDRVSAWSGVLASLCRQGGTTPRLQWIARCLPIDPRRLAPDWSDGAATPHGERARRSYSALVEAEVGRACRHEVLLVVTVRAANPGMSKRARARGNGHVSGCSALVRQAAWLVRQLSDAGLHPGPLLDQRQLTDAVRSAFDTRPATGVRHHDAWPWPMAIEASWGRARVDGTWHTTYWIAEWPRRDVNADFLAPLVLADVRRTVALVMEPVAALDAARRVEQARTAEIADAQLRRRGGFLESARRRRQEETLVRREDELADGHSQYRFSAYVTVTGDDEAELEDACARTEQAAGLAGLELRRCYGDQGRAFTCTLPLGRGLS